MCVLVYTSTYQHVPVHTGSYWYILVHTSTYQFIPVHTFSDLGSKNMQTDFEPEIFCILFTCIPTALQEYRHQIQDMQQWKCLCTCSQCSGSCLCTWLLMSDRWRRSRSAPGSGHDVPRQDLDWHLTIASPCLPQQAGFNLCQPDAVPVFKMQVTLSLAVPVPVPRPGAHWLPSQCVGQAFQLNPSTQKQNIKILKRQHLLIRHALKGATCHHWKGRTCFAVQCFWLLYSV
jgi:hypothetical protein